jgi:serine protease Do
MMVALTSAFLALLLQDEPDKAHVRLYRKAAPATVAVEGGQKRGSGVLVDKSGIVLTSTTACSAAARVVTVYVHGAKSYRAKVLGRDVDHELVVLKIEGDSDFPALALGDSDAVRVGQLSYVLGDSYDSIRVDDQPAVSVGAISGIYEIGKNKNESTYRGKVLETSAAVNPNQNGGPLVDREGRLLGLVTLNYEESKFTGLAVPVNALKPVIERIRREAEDPAPVAKPAPAAGEAWFGAEVKAADGGLEIVRVAPKGPAEQAGLRKGDLIARIGDVKALTEAALRKSLAGRPPGEAVTVQVLRDGAAKEFRVTLAARPVY